LSIDLPLGSIRIGLEMFHSFFGRLPRRTEVADGRGVAFVGGHQSPERKEEAPATTSG
jgi:hypothetical protein